MKSNANWSFSGMHNLYPVSRTIAFQAVPVWETREMIDQHCIIANDKLLAADAAVVKELIRREHRTFIEEVLSGFSFKYHSDGNLDSVEDYIALRRQLTADDEDTGEKKLETVRANLMKAVEKAFATYEREGEKVLPLMNSPQKLLTKILPEREMTDAERESLGRVQKFTTYFMDIVSRYAAYYKADEEGHTIPARLVDDNLPILLANTRLVQTTLETLGEVFDKTCDELGGAGVPAYNLLMKEDAPAHVTSQRDIERYNACIGGLVLDDGKTKVKGLNEVINLHNQTAGKKDRLRKLEQLKKQILTEREPLSWLPQKFDDDGELITAIRETVSLVDRTLDAKAQLRLQDLVSEATGKKSGLFIDSRRVSDVSHSSLGRWDTIRKVLSDYLVETGRIVRKKRETDDKLAERIWKTLERRGGVSAELIDNALRWDDPAQERSCLAFLKDIPTLSAQAVLLGSEAVKALDAFEAKASNATDTVRIADNREAVDAVKLFLDTLKEFTKTCGWITQRVADGTPDGETCDLLNETASAIDEVVCPLYDKTRNYLTQRETSRPLTINASNSVLFSGLDVNMEKTKCGVFFRKGKTVYAGILIKRNCTKDIPEDPGSQWSKIDFKFLGKAYQMVPKVCISTAKALERFRPSEEILDIYDRRKNLDPTELSKLIGYFIRCIESGTYESWDAYHFTFRKPDEYASLNDFYEEIQDKAYCTSARPVSEDWLRKRVAAGDILLFEITSRYMKPGHHGRDDKRKRILEYAFSDENLASGEIRICGGEKLTYREPSKEKRVTHPAGVPMDNKNPDNPRRTRTLPYDLYKDKRYMEERFSFSIPLVLNNNAKAQQAGRTNYEVNDIIRRTPGLNVLGINRGENNLISYAVTAPDGRILDQGHFNTIDGYNYQALLASLERSRTRSRRDWDEVESIKNTKAGYLSLATTEILTLAAKWDCVIAMESLNADFKEKRQRFERNVYQQFERDLCTRLQYNELEDRPVTEGLQLTRGDMSLEESNNYPQNGVLFFVSPWMISRTVPGQPFVAIRPIDAERLDKAQAFFGRLKKAVYDAKDNVFEFTFPESALQSLPEGVEDRDVTVCTYGERVVNRIDYQNFNTPYDEVHLLSQEMMKTLQDAGIAVSGDMAEAIRDKGVLKFYQQVARNLNLAMRPTSLYAAQRNKEFRVHGCVRGADGAFYDSRFAPDGMPKDGDTLAAWNVARKCHLFLKTIRETEQNARLTVTSADWIKLARHNGF